MKITNARVLDVGADEVVAYVRPRVITLDRAPDSLLRLLIINATTAEVYRHAHEAGTKTEELKFLVLQIHELAHRELDEFGVRDYDDQHEIMDAVERACQEFAHEKAAATTVVES